MKLTFNRSAAGAIAVTALLLTLAPSARATTFPDLVYDVTLNVAPLSLDPNQPFSLDLQLVTGSGNQTNTVTLTNFSFIGGTPLGTSFSAGNVSGSLANGLVLTSNTPNTALDNEFAEAFSAGTTQITFRVDQTPNSETVGSGTPIPEQFNVAVLDSGLNNVPTTDPSGGNALLSSPLGSNSTIATVNTFVTVGPDGGVFAVAAAPEPNSAFLGLAAAGVMFALLRRRFNRAV